MGRPRNRPPGDDWKKKLHSVFFELAEVNREFEKCWATLQTESRRQLQAANPKRPDLQKRISARFLRETQKLERWFEERLVDINRRYTPVPYNPIAYGYFTLDPPISDSEAIREYMHFHRHGEPLRVSEMKDSQGDLDAWDKISRTERDVRILAFGKGPIAPFQEDVVHRQLMQLVICYESERLTPEELTQCFDKYCTCGKETHDPGALRKMRDRFEAELRAGQTNQT